ncbi:Endonuclease/exonuclease/phosphatase, partial [Blakeslea trispora]
MSQHQIHIATLNCRGLVKTNDSTKRSLFFRFLRSTQTDIFCFQETHAKTASSKSTLDMMLQSHSSLWNEHCGIVSFNPLYIVQPHGAIVASDARFILAAVGNTNNPTSPLMHILNIYAPATRQARLAFFRDLASNLSLMSFLHSLTAPIIIVGDFNYDLHQQNTIDSSWSNLLSGAFHDCFDHMRLPTFVSTTGSRSLLDYIFCSSTFSDNVVSMSHSFVNYSWTDHALLSISYRISCETMGKGSWKGNPFLAKLPSYREGLTSHIQNYVQSERLLDPHQQRSTQTIWDQLKAQVKQYTRSFQLDRLNWQKKSLKRLQSKRNRILRDYKNTAVLSSLLPTVEALIGDLQSEIASIDQLKAGKSW